MKVLKYYEALAYAAKNDHDFSNIVATKVIPLMRIMAPSLYCQWEQEKRTHVTSRLDLEARALDETTQYVEILKQRLDRENLLQNSSIKQHICVVETMLSFGANRKNMFIKKSIDPEETLVWEYKKTKSGSKKLDLVTKKKEFEYVCLSCEGLEVRHRVFVLPSYVWGVCKEVEELCKTIMKLGRVDLVEDGLLVRYIIETQFFEQREGTILQAYWCECGYIYHDQTANKDDKGSLIPFDELPEDWHCPYRCPKKDFEKYRYPVVCNIPHVDAFTFAPSFYELQILNDLLAKDSRYREENNVWVAMENLYRIEWAWNISRDYLRKKKLNYADAEDCAKSAMLLGLNNLTAEVNALKPKQKQNKYAFFCKRDTMKENLDIVLREIYGTGKNNQIDDREIPYAIELMLEDDIELRLLVEWAPGIMEKCHLHSFQDTDYRCDFIDDLLRYPGKQIKINSPHGIIENARELIRRSGIKGILAMLFIDKAKADMAMFKSKRIVLGQMPEPAQKKLRNLIQTYKSLGWH